MSITSHKNSPDITSEMTEETVDVIVPVHNASELVSRCIQSVISCRQQSRFEVLVIDDGSTEREAVQFLKACQARGEITLLRNERSLGFVSAVNRGMACHPDRNVVLLNSDAEVANNWLDRIQRCARADAKIGTVTPFSNNATICSFPQLCSDNPLPEGTTLTELDRVFSEVNDGQWISIPTAVGFCMYINRACIREVGLFDEQRFGRGYGEENDFCQRAMRLGWKNILCTDTFVFHVGSGSFKGEREPLSKSAEAILLQMHPDYLINVRSFIRRDPAAPFRRAVEIELARRRAAIPSYSIRQEVQVSASLAYFQLSPHRIAEIARDGRPVQLHVLHDLGGGVDRWCRDYCRTDTTRLNLILRPFCRGHAFGEGLMLFADVDDLEPIGLWMFSTPFEVTAISHPEYRQAIGSIIADYNVGAVLVSSLIGHALDALATGLPTVLVAHDFFPACPAINLYFDRVCIHCDDERMARCARENPDHNPFVQYQIEDRIAVRKRFLALIENRAVTVVVASRSVWTHLVSLFPVLVGASWALIPHGMDSQLKRIDAVISETGERLRVVVLGMLSVSKGIRLLEEALERLTDFSDIYLVGAKEAGELFVGRRGVHVVRHYQLSELQSLVQQIKPHVGLLMSILPETYSYTLTELQRLGIPAIATRLGSFAERISDGDTGFLVEPNADAMVRRLRDIHLDTRQLGLIRSNLLQLPQRSAADMVNDYHALLPVRQFPKEHGEPNIDGASRINDPLIIRQATSLTTMWKEIKSLALQLEIVRDAGAHPMDSSRVAERQRQASERQRDIAEHQRAVAEHQRAVAEQQRALAEIQFQQERLYWSEQRAQYQKDMGLKNDQIQGFQVQVKSREKHLEDVLASTSWRITKPVRWLGINLRRARFAFRCLAPLISKPGEAPEVARRIFNSALRGGLPQLRLVLLDLQAELSQQSAWKVYKRTFANEVHPQIIAAIQSMSRRPVISIIVPVFNTPKRMLKEMIESVLGQLYIDWELCLADDGSTDKHTLSVIQRYAKGDSRIKTYFGTENRGVSYASNRALELASGDFVVLLDHDDVLEEQALFRVAQSIVSDDPDMIYSDEILLSEKLDTVLQYALRPAFSLEYLRSHPFIVHLVGFRTRLIRELGGFNESLTISQDYDMVLRAAEVAHRIVHIPEILYQWRIHGHSSGKVKMDAVMRTSATVLQDHLRRSESAALSQEGGRFNLFEARYPLAENVKVAIVIPTKNHGELVRQCIDSLKATIKGINYDIYVVNHDSDEPDTIEYLASIESEAKVLPYSGPFNFSAINNWAISQISEDYSHYLLCNNDIEARNAGWLDRMLELGQLPDVGIVGAQLLYADGTTIQHAGVCVGAYGAAEHFGKFLRVADIQSRLGFSEILASNHEVSAVTAACLLIKREAYEAVSGFDEALAVGFGDVDLCLRVGKLGYRILYCPHASLIHHESLSRGKSSGVDPHPADSALFQHRWHDFLENGDPYFNPGLDRNSTVWQIQIPMRCNREVKRRIFDKQTITARRPIFSFHS